MNTILSIKSSPKPSIPYSQQIPQSELCQKITDIMEKQNISEPLLEDFLLTHRKSLAIFAIKNPFYWHELSICMRRRLKKDSRISKLIKNLNKPILSHIFPKEIRNCIALTMIPLGFKNVDTLKKMRLLFLGDTPPLKKTITLDGIPIQTLALWIKQNRVPLFTLIKTCDELEDLVPELEYVDLTRYDLERHFTLLTKVDKVRQLTIQFISERETEQLIELEHLSSLTFQTCGMLDTDRQYIKQLPRLTSLNFITCYHITDDALRVLRYMTNLTSLGIIQCEQITNTGIKSISVLSNLTNLSLAYCKNTTDEGLLHLKDLPLKILDITYCHELTNAGIAPFKLQHLNFKYCHKITWERSQNI